LAHSPRPPCTRCRARRRQRRRKTTTSEVGPAYPVEECRQIEEEDEDDGDEKNDWGLETAEKPGETYHSKDLADIVTNAWVHGPAHRDNLAAIILAERKAPVYHAVGVGAVSTSYVAFT
jgi:hypothetical protein